MNSRELVLLATATVFGAVASALAVRFFSFNQKRHFPRTDSSGNSAVSNNGYSQSQSPFDPSKRKGLVRYLKLQRRREISLFKFSTILYASFVFIYLFTVRLYFRYLSWDDYFMAIAFLSAERSKDPNRQVGACLVSQNGVILGIGYNGFPRGCSDDKLPWAKKSKTGNPLETKYPYVCHAEVNAILNTNHASAVGQKLYVTMFPCNECAKIIIQSGVSEVIYFVEKNLSNSDTTYIASHKLLSMAGIKVRKHQPQMSRILVKFEDS